MDIHIPSVQEAKQKAALVRKNLLSSEEKREVELLRMLAKLVQEAIDNTMPINDSYTIIVAKKDLQPMLQRVLSKFTQGMKEEKWMVAIKETRSGFKTYLKITFCELKAH
jgi:hypothetical protein